MRRARAILGLAALVLLTAARPALRLGPPPPAQPRRVVTLAPSLTEAVLALGAGDRLVGVTRYDDAPQVRGLPRVGGYVDPSVEAVLALGPDLILVEPSPGNRAAVERMAALGLPVLSVYLTTEQEILAGLRELAAALGVGDRGTALAERTGARIEAVRARARALPPVRALVVYDWDPLVVAGPGSYADSLLRAAGGANAASGARSAYAVFSAELAMRAAPQVIIDAADMRDPPRERILKLPVLNRARLEIGSPDLFRPGPRLGDAVEEIFALLHPRATGPSIPPVAPPGRAPAESAIAWPDEMAAEVPTAAKDQTPPNDAPADASCGTPAEVIAP